MPEPRGGDEARRRLCLLGASALADHELVSVLLSQGRARAGELLRPGLRALAQLDLEGLQVEAGLSRADAQRVVAAVELGRRCLAAQETRARLATPHEVYHHVRHRLSALRCEQFLVLCFNARHVLLKEAVVARGSTSHCQVDPREVFAPAVAARASAVVLVHNHPSGDPEPSQLDVSLTLQLREAGRALCVRVLDHLVLGDRGYVSFVQRGLLDDEVPGAPLLMARP